VALLGNRRELINVRLPLCSVPLVSAPKPQSALEFSARAALVSCFFPRPKNSPVLVAGQYPIVNKNSLTNSVFVELGNSNSAKLDEQIA